MSLTNEDGSTLTAALRPFLNWTGIPQNRLEKLELIYGTLDDEHFPGGIIPRLNGGVMQYYAITRSAEEWRELVPMLRAAVGSTITDFDEQRLPFDEEDPLESVLIESGYPRGAHFTAGSDVLRGRYALTALSRLRTLVDESLVSNTVAPRATGEVLRSFELALASFDRASAEKSLAFLRTNLRLDAINLGFLTIRLLSTFQEWERICRMEQFTSLCQTRRTPRITTVMVEALYQTRILEFEQDDDPQQAIAVFRNDIMTTTGTLFDTCPAHVTPAAGKAFLLAALTAAPQNTTLVNQLIETASDWPDHEAKFFHRIVGSAFEETPSVTTVDVQPRTYEDEVELLRTELKSPTLQRATAGLIAATQLDTLDAFQAVVEYVGMLDAAEREILLSNAFNGPAFARMQEEAGGGTVPKTWVEWISQLENVSVTESQEFAKRAAEEWRVHDQLRTESDVRDLTSAISGVPAGAQDRLFDTITYLVQWVQSDRAWPESHLVPLYRSIYDHLMVQLSLRWWQEAAGTARELLDGMLQLGLESADYKRILNDMSDVLPMEAGAADFDFLMELTELTVINSSPDPNARQELWARIIAVLGSVQTRLTRGDLALVNDLGQVFGMSEVFPVPPLVPEEQETGPSPLDGKLIAIYTLTEQAGDRAKRLLVDLYPNIRVELSHDHGGNTRLEGLARNADIFVVCWRSAAHAATDVIGRYRPADSPTLYPDGKGTSSIMRAVRQHSQNYSG